ncbi:hypothetical protein BKA58DRAFT_232859 [Alternaria rosae]|uniref:uncharacterized protein n=1 Tax=Alternaria rosae TaxID=1187941 RepID=UPI001E8D7C7A|nr:uncharacterized protein BKA58DRAFT_232859 [Alternaria rosae]KAH6864780.1 hypothetical protein BKA58DRAFT_232859 [Alternaria rosae]
MVDHTVDVPMAAVLKPPFSSRSIPLEPPIVPSPKSQSSGSQGAVNTNQPAIPNPTATGVQLHPLDSLPTTFTRWPIMSLVDNDLKTFLKCDLDLSRLDVIQEQLWMPSTSKRAAPIHRHRVFGYNIHGVQQMDLHLVRDSAPRNRLMIKPLPEWMLSHEFWSNHLCNDYYVHASACGFLLSYLWLIETPLDLKIAHEHSLLPTFITWYWWRTFVTEASALLDVNTLDYVKVNERYKHGVLQLERLNTIYQQRPGHLTACYFHPTRHNTSFVAVNLNWIIGAPFVFLTVVLSAMQVGTGLDGLEKSDLFQRASYVMVLLSMICVAVLLVVLFVEFGLAFCYNIVLSFFKVREARKDLE